MSSEATAALASDGPWGVVEIMGRRTRAGLLSDVQIGGATLLRIEHPSRADHTGNEPLCEYYSPQAIFAIRPCSRADAEKVAAWAWPAPATGAQRELPAAFAELVDDDEEVDLDEEAWTS